MAWSANIIDTNNHILLALRIAGFSNLTPASLEMILNISELVKEKGADTTIRDITRTEDCVKGLFQNEDLV